MSILATIVEEKFREVKAAKALVSAAQLKRDISELPKTRDFAGALREPGISLIAEVKKASPSKGLIREDFDPVEIAQIYTTYGAAAISVLTDVKFFQGDLSYLANVRRVTNLPLLRKDFIIDEYQILEARRFGADAILLIAAILEDDQLTEFLQVAQSLGLDCLVEVHSKDEMARVLKTPAEIIGINNRNLNTFKTTLDTTFSLKDMVLNDNIILVSESGINTQEDVQNLDNAGVDAILVGEALMRAENIGQQIELLLGQVKACG